MNADEIAKDLSPFQPEKVAFEAGRIMINRINERLKENKSFAFETTLSTRRYFKGIFNLFDLYLPIINGALIFDNSYGKHELIAHKMWTDRLEVINLEKFEQLKKVYDTKR